MLHNYEQQRKHGMAMALAPCLVPTTAMSAASVRHMSLLSMTMAQYTGMYKDPESIDIFARNTLVQASGNGHKAGHACIDLHAVVCWQSHVFIRLRLPWLSSAGSCS